MTHVQRAYAVLAKCRDSISKKCDQSGSLTDADDAIITEINQILGDRGSKPNKHGIKMLPSSGCCNGTALYPNLKDNRVRIIDDEIVTIVQLEEYADILGGADTLAEAKRDAKAAGWKVVQIDK